MEKEFLKQILGDKGYAVIEKALDKNPLLKAVVVPRSIVSWLSVMGKIGYEGEIPGIKDSFIALSKNEDGFDGAIVIDSKLFELEKSDIFHVAASVGVALGVDLESIDSNLNSGDLSELGKNLDLLVKSNLVKSSQVSQPKNTIKNKSIKLTKNESKTVCEECGGNQFINNKFTGCMCISDLAKGVKTELNNDGYTLNFNMLELDDDAVSTIISVFK